MDNCFQNWIAYFAAKVDRNRVFVNANTPEFQMEHVKRWQWPRRNVEIVKVDAFEGFISMDDSIGAQISLHAKGIRV